MNLKSRVDHLERRHSAGGGCSHGYDLRGLGDYDYDAASDTRPARQCEICGREQTIIQMVYLSGRAERA